MKPFPDYTAVSYYRNNVGTTNYHGVSFSIRQRMSRGLTYSAAYTRSKLTDVASSVFDASILTGPLTNAAVADSHNLERDRDYSTGDIPHYFGGSVVWDLPFGSGRAKNPGVPVASMRARVIVRYASLNTASWSHPSCSVRRSRSDSSSKKHDPAPSTHSSGSTAGR